MRLEKENLQKSILSALTVVGLLSISIVAPNIIQLIDLVAKNSRRRKAQVKRALQALEKQRLIRRSHDRIVMTKKGMGHYSQLTLMDLKTGRPDGQRRYFIFDIPIRFNKKRQYLLRVLKKFGFTQQQRSVWVIKAECTKTLREVCRVLRIGPYCELILVEKIISL